MRIYRSVFLETGKEYENDVAVNLTLDACVTELDRLQKAHESEKAYNGDNRTIARIDSTSLVVAFRGQSWMYLAVD